MSDVKRDDIVRLRLLKSDQFLHSAHRLTKASDWSSAVSFLYYAAFHALMGLLKTSGANVKSHSGARKMFDAQYIKSGLIGNDHGRFYMHLYRERDKSDHQDFAVLTADDVLPLLPQTEEFIDVIKRLINTN